MALHDLIVIGGGLSGGLPAAAYLQKSGLDVLVLEANSELASFCCATGRTPIDGFYLGGGAIHPGLPGSLGGGVNVARAVAEDLKLGA